MRPLATLFVVIFCLTLATVDSDGHRRSSINTLHRININDINNIASTANNNYTKNVFTNNNASLNATIVLPVSVLPHSTLSSSSANASTATLTPPSTLTPLPALIHASAAAATESSVFRDKRGTALDPAEIARQNQITQQILSNYLERRLFPERVVSQKIPTIADILPKPTISTTSRPSTFKQRSRPRGFSPSSKKSPPTRKTYGQRKTPNSLQHVLKHKNNGNRDDEQLNNEDEYQEESEIDTVEAEDEENIHNTTLKDKERHRYDDDEEPEEEDEFDEPPRYSSSSRHYHRYRHSGRQSRRPSYHSRYYDDDIEQDGQEESLQSVESEQHDRYYKSKGDIFARDPSENEIDSDCPHCVDETQYMNKWTMPLLKLGEKRYYLGIFFKANWFKASQYCRYHGMHLASISSQEENDRLEKHIKDFGLGHEHFWTSGTDLADEGNFFWMATGRPITFTNWNAGEPNNFRYENGEEENCLELWNRDGKGLKWNDSPCSFETYFVCEVQP